MRDCLLQQTTRRRRVRRKGAAPIDSPCKKINRSHTHTHRQRTTPPTPTHRRQDTIEFNRFYIAINIPYVPIEVQIVWMWTQRPWFPRCATVPLHGVSCRAWCKKINRSHTHTPTENNTPVTDTHTRQEQQHPKPPNEHLPQTLNNAQRSRNDGS